MAMRPQSFPGVSYLILHPLNRFCWYQRDYVNSSGQIPIYSTQGTIAVVTVIIVRIQGSSHLVSIRYSRSFRKGIDIAEISLPKEFNSISSSSGGKNGLVYIPTSPLTKFGKSNREQDLLQMSAPDSVRIACWLLVFSRFPLSNF